LLSGEFSGQIFAFAIDRSNIPITVTVTPENDAPEAVGLPTSAQALEDVASNLDLSAVRLTDGDAADTLKVVLTASAGTMTAVGIVSVTGTADVTVTGSGSGILTLTGRAAAIDDWLKQASAIRYTGAQDANGIAAAVVTITVDDGSGAVSLGAVDVNITGAPDAPMAKDDALSTDQDTAISGSVLADNGAGADADVDGDALTIAEAGGAAAFVGAPITLASGALLTVTAGGFYDYDPNGAFDALAAGEHGADSFAYIVTDGALTAEATVTIDITGVNDAPEITSGAAFAMAEGGLAVGTVTAQDVDLSDTLIFAVDAGGDGALFDIDAATGALSFLAAPDHGAAGDAGADNVYDLTVSVFDGAATVRQAIAVTVTDVIRGGAAGEVLRGGSGADQIRSGGGPLDQAYGGAGADTFVFENIVGARDVFRIRDFTFGVDHLDLNGESVVRVAQSARSTMVLLDGDDHDLIIIDGVGIGYDLFA
jgi:VCBS repeat-containing protein